MVKVLFQNNKNWASYKCLFRKSEKMCLSQNFFNRFQKQPLEVFHKKAILKYFVIFTGKHLCWSLFFNKVSSHQACNLIKKGLQQKYFLVNIRKLIRTPILKNICEQLHLKKTLWPLFMDGVQLPQG